MIFYEYFQSYENYFWQWEEDTEVLAIPNGDTIAYRDQVFEIIENLVPFGVPRFGTLLLAIIATNTRGEANIERMCQFVRDARDNEVSGAKRIDDECLVRVKAFLTLLTELPERYKKENGRVQLFQTIFKNSHNILSSRASQELVGCFKYRKDINKLLWQKDLNGRNIFSDFVTLELLSRKFTTVNDILAKMGNLPEIEEAIILEESVKEAPAEKDLIEELIENEDTFEVGALVKRIWSGLNLPVNSVVPTQQPTGGVSDLTNKGSFDRLLISEYANDDLVFLSRLANNEALYIQRETPPSSHNKERVILIDVSLKTWGTPKTIAFAVMLAIAKHPKTKAECSVYTIGESSYPIEIDTVDDIIDGLEEVEASLHAAEGLTAFFKENPADANREVFVITASSTLRNVAMQKAASDHFGVIDYWIQTEVSGEVNVYKNQRKSKRHIQKIVLPMEELWAGKKKKKEKRKQTERTEYFPILFPHTHNDIAKLDVNGFIFKFTKDGAIMKLHRVDVKFGGKGWLFLYGNVQKGSRHFEVGILKNGDYVVILLRPHKKEITLVNLRTKERKLIPFEYFKQGDIQDVVFVDEKFCYLNGGRWTIDMDGNVKQAEVLSLDVSAYIERRKEIKQTTVSHNLHSMVFKNIISININAVGNLVLNGIHELILNRGGHIKLDKLSNADYIYDANINDTGIFEFRDGSTVEVNRNGMLILKSSDVGIPTIYVPSVLGSALGIATDEMFAGNEFYYIPNSDVTIIRGEITTVLEKIATTEFFNLYMEPFINNIKMYEA